MRPIDRMLTGQVAAVLTVLVSVMPAGAQTLGTFRWQLQPFCNVVTVTVTQSGAVYTLDGYDDQCGAPQRAPLVGLATPNPDGSIGHLSRSTSSSESPISCTLVSSVKTGSTDSPRKLAS